MRISMQPSERSEKQEGIDARSGPTRSDQPPDRSDPSRVQGVQHDGKANNGEDTFKSKRYARGCRDQLIQNPSEECSERDDTESEGQCPQGWLVGSAIRSIGEVGNESAENQGDSFDYRDEQR